MAAGRAGACRRGHPGGVRDALPRFVSFRFQGWPASKPGGGGALWVDSKSGRGRALKSVRQAVRSGQVQPKVRSDQIGSDRSRQSVVRLEVLEHERPDLLLGAAPHDDVEVAIVRRVALRLADRDGALGAAEEVGGLLAACFDVRLDGWVELGRLL